MVNIKKLESELWESADLLRQGSRLTSQEYCMPVLGLIFLRYAYSRFKYVEAEIMKNRPMRGGRVLPVEAGDFKAKNALFLPEEARYDYLLNLPESANLGQAVNRAMELMEAQSAQLNGILPKTYTSFKDALLNQLLRIFNNSALDEIKDDVIGRIYEYFLNKFAPAVASDDGVFFTPKSLVRMIVNIIEPTHGTVLDPACGSGGMFVSSSDFVEQFGVNANSAMTFFGQEKVDYNAKLCLMNMAVHGLNAKIVSGDEANSFYNDHFNLNGCCDYVMANPPFNVDKVNSESAQNAGRLPFGLPTVNKKTKEVSNANYLWISYFYSYLNESGRAGFVMASSATDSSGKDKLIREKLIETGHVDVIISVGNNFFYTKSLPCSLWFFDKGKPEALQDKILFIDARNYYTAVDRTLNEWSEWQMKNLNAIVWLYRGEVEKYVELCQEYYKTVQNELDYVMRAGAVLGGYIDNEFVIPFNSYLLSVIRNSKDTQNIFAVYSLLDDLRNTIIVAKEQIEKWMNYVSNLQKDAQKEIVKTKELKTLAEYKRGLATDLDIFVESVENLCQIILDAKWLTDKFGEGEYQDISGLCKIADRADVLEKGSLTPGAYVGVAPVEDDGVDFKARMAEIHRELLTLQAESNALMETISRNMEEMGV